MTNNALKRIFIQKIFKISGIVLIGLLAQSSFSTAKKKEVIGYITQWDAWKGTDHGLPAKAVMNHLNVDYSKYTQLNFSFFGVANDGSLHSGDFRNKKIWEKGTVQKPADILNGDVYSSFDYYLLFGDTNPAFTLTEEAKNQGFTLNGSNWSNSKTGLTGKLPIPVRNVNGAKGLLELGEENGVKIMASIGGWSMCRHFPEMAADPTKRAKFIEDIKKLIKIGFDGIDIDWEYPGPFEGMNFKGSDADYGNFLTMMKEIREAIGPDKLLTAAFSADVRKLKGFDWSALNKEMDYYNFMTYDFNGGWSNKAGHNSPLYPYENAEFKDFNWDTLHNHLKETKIDMGKATFGIAFYGRGVNTKENAELNGETVKIKKTIQPDGPIETAADWDNFGKFQGVPHSFYLKQKIGDWQDFWDDEAKVPYVTNGKHFLSFDNEKSIRIKSEYIKEKGMGGTIVWQVFGDMECTGGVSGSSKLPKCNNLNSPLANTINEVFSSK